MLSACISTVYEEFLAPVLNLLPNCSSSRICPSLSDSHWIQLCIERTLQECNSARAFFQTHGIRLPSVPDYSLYFQSLKSLRRLQLVGQLNADLRPLLSTTLPDRLSDFPQLNGFDVYAGDGHWHKPAVHDSPYEDGKRYPVGHFYSLDLRTHALSRLTTAEGRKEHDMHALKRLSNQALRQGAPKGRKVLYVWDKAAIDFRFWHNRKHSAGVYFISLEKENMKLEPMGIHCLNSADPINHGIQKDELVGSASGVMLRRVTYIAADTAEEYVFLTNEMTLPAGLIAHLYQRRWNVEKVFDSLKNKFGEKKAWASSKTAKAIQAESLCLTHNLTLIMEQTLAVREKVVNEPDRQRRRQRQEKQRKKAQEAQRPFPSTWESFLDPVHCSVKLIRWLRSCFTQRLHWHEALALIRALYANL